MQKLSPQRTTFVIEDITAEIALFPTSAPVFTDDLLLSESLVFGKFEGGADPEREVFRKSRFSGMTHFGLPLTLRLFVFVYSKRFDGSQNLASVMSSEMGRKRSDRPSTSKRSP
jgi:hypothetical protein